MSNIAGTQLYHFTNSWECILGSKKLWAKHYKKVRNDVKELKHAKEFIKQWLVESEGKIPPELIDDFIENALYYGGNPVFLYSYISCFFYPTQNLEDDINGGSSKMWKDYGEVAFVFNKDKLIDKFNSFCEQVVSENGIVRYPSCDDSQSCFDEEFQGYFREIEELFIEIEKGKEQGGKHWKEQGEKYWDGVWPNKHVKGEQVLL